MWVVGIRQDCQGRHTDSVGSERLEGGEGENHTDPSGRAFQTEGTAPLRLDSALHVGRTEGRLVWQDRSELEGEREEQRKGRGPGRSCRALWAAGRVWVFIQVKWRVLNRGGTDLTWVLTGALW